MSGQFVFGSGQLYKTPVGGGAPLKFGTLQDVNIDFKGDMKKLHGQFSFPLAVGRGKVEVTIKAGNGALDINLYNDLFFGEPGGISSGSYDQIINEAGTIPSTPYQITVANGANFYMDLGVTKADGTPLKQVASMPATGQYSVSAAGVYTFAAADTTNHVLISYIYTVTGGSKLVLTNQLIGAQPTFQLNLMETFQGQWAAMQFNSVICPSLTMPLKLDDFMISELEFMPQVDAANNLGWLATNVA